MSLLRRLEMLEDAMLGQGNDEGYQLVMMKEGEMPQDAITRSRLTSWPRDRIILISFVKAGEKSRRTS
jgi:hypothetical protein